ncbi:MAG TPA: biotin-dependent carboxyltransferase family protein [Gaiellaceae bacterium]|nr:biotin-dependent carboxyltransferase family protein [Gaiellaceae bacterium]
MIEVLAAGPLTTVQDRGRPGWAHLGVPPSGAADPQALALGNRLVGNDTGAAGLEATLSGPRLRFRAVALVALTGAETEASIEPNRPFEISAGEVLELGRFLNGVRAYVSVRGGIDVEPVLGSRSTDLLSGLGPPQLREGDVLPIGREPTISPQDVEPPAPLPVEPTLRLLPGPRDDWFAPNALAGTWRVSSSSNRVGVRLEGPPIERVRHEELLSEGVLTGALQVPRSGQPIILLNDHPTTGGYPVLGVVHADDLPLAGQLRPGQRLSFVVRHSGASAGTP